MSLLLIVVMAKCDPDIRIVGGGRHWFMPIL